LISAQGLSRERDTLLQALAPSELKVPLLALGGYGRQEMSPGSDLDLLFLSEAAEPAGVEALIRALWDQRLQLGFATRGLSECLSLAQEDLHSATALLSARSILGPPEIAGELRVALMEALKGTPTQTHLKALAQGRAERHERYGGSVYLLEPNLKQSPGGLRDLHLIFWAAALSQGLERWEELSSRGLCSPQAQEELNQARERLLRLRIALHQAAPYGGDRLTFGHQEVVAERLGYGEGRGAVESFMAEYYRLASIIKRRSGLILERCLRAQGFAPAQRCLSLSAPINGRRALALFLEAQRQSFGIEAQAKEAIMEAVPTWGSAWRQDPEVLQDFFELLCAPEDPLDALGELHEVGILSALIPEFGSITHRSHHDLYHLYTVDVHSLRALRCLKAIERAEPPINPLLQQAMSQVQGRKRLYLALLLHDIGKGLGRGHAIKGARLIPGIVRRLGLKREAGQQIAWLVRDHLLLIHCSQRMDLSDEGLLRQLARRVGDLEGLSMLYLLTWADASTTGPQALTDWKASLLAELYAQVARRLKRGLDLYEDPERMVERRRRALTRWLLRNRDPRLMDVGGELEEFFASLPTAYFRRTRARDLARHLEMLQELKHSPLALRQRSRPRRGYTHLHVAAIERMGLLPAVAGVLTLHRLDIISADLHHSSDGRSLNLLRVRAEEGGAPAAERWAPVERDLRLALSGALDLEEQYRALDRRRARRFSWPEGPAIETQISWDDQLSQETSLLILRAQDQPGLLYTVVQVIEAQGCRLHMARITTEGDAAHDRFYLSEWASVEPLSTERQASLKSALSKALG